MGGKLFIVPQLPIKNRYQERWINWWKEEAEGLKINFEMVDLGKEAVEKTNYFTNEREAIVYEMEQIKYLLDKVREGDKVLWLDLDYPAFSLPFNHFLVKKGVSVYGIVHGAYFNKGDIWNGLDRKDFMRAELGICRKVFVGTMWFKEQLVKRLGIEFWNKIIVHYLPFYYKNLTPNFEKENVIFVIGNKNIPKPFNRTFITVSGVRYEIIRGEKDYSSYIEDLKRSKFLISFKEAETFGYSVVEAMASGTIPLLPNRFCYPELKRKAPMIQLWRTKNELLSLIRKDYDVRKLYEQSITFFEELTLSAKNILMEVISDGFER